MAWAFIMVPFALFPVELSHLFQRVGSIRSGMDELQIPSPCGVPLVSMFHYYFSFAQRLRHLRSWRQPVWVGRGWVVVAAGRVRSRALCARAMEGRSLVVLQLFHLNPTINHLRHEIRHLAHGFFDDGLALLDSRIGGSLVILASHSV